MLYKSDNASNWHEYNNPSKIYAHME
jgi:hypothetical protein